MQRYFLDDNAVLNQSYSFAQKDDIHHIKNVMRQQTGDHVIINFLNGSYEVEITDIHNAVEVKVLSKLEIDVELPVEVGILSGLLKNDKYEWMIQKATELGASHFYPYQAEYSVVKWDTKKVDKKLDRMKKIIKEAAEQSYRQMIPSIEFISNITGVCDIIGRYDYVMVAYEESAKAYEVSQFHQLISQLKRGDKLLIIFGPEGGLTPKEIDTFGALTAGLGPRILRAETAPLYALSAISYHLELMR